MRLALLCSLAGAALLVGCPGIGDIDRTQPDKVLKSIFKNSNGTPKEFYFRQTVIDVPATNGVTFIGEQSDTERVVFDVQEDFLYAYRSYGWLQNAEGEIPGQQGDGYVRPGTGAYHGAPVAAFRVLSHFDVKRQYNPTTGEQTNVLMEDIQDRPWYDREYVRVDWSTNMIADFRFGAATALQTPASRDISQTDANSKDAPVVTGSYIDIVTEMNVEPEAVDLTAYGYGMLPQCYFYTGIYKDCLGGTIRVRSSFREVTPSDYLPADYDDLRFQKFGFFRTERFRYDDQYGIVEPAQIRLANRWNLWKDAGSCYDKDADLPYANCSPSQLRTVVYYLNEDFPRDPAELLGMAKDNGESWNVLFKEAVKASTGWSDADIGDRRLFTLCANNPVADGDPAECGEPGTNPQIGDLRYSMYYYVPNWQQSPPLGYGPSAADPLTGEIIAGNAFYYGAAGATIAARSLDIIKLELGLLDDEDISGGLPARMAIQQSRDGAANRSFRWRGDNVAEKARRLADNKQIKGQAERLQRLIERGDAFHDKRAARTVALKNSGLDEYALTDEMKEVFGGQLLETGVPVDQADSVLAAQLFDNDMLFRREQIRRERLMMTPAHGCILMAEDVFDDGMLGLLRKVRSKFYDTATEPPTLKPGYTEQNVYNYMLAQTMGDTQLHEIGHTVGLRHNFAGSTDALNFGPTYWELRGNIRPINGARPVPEWQIDQARLRRDFEIALEEGLRDNQDSSVMDYASTYGTSTQLGAYDLAAIKYAYGDVVEVFNGADLTAERAKLLSVGELHYTRYPEVVSNGATYEERVAAMYDRRNVNFRKVTKLDEAQPGDPIEVPYAFCSDEYRDASATCAVWDQGADNFERTTYAADHYRNYRLLNSFKRERLTFGVDVFSYLSRVYTVDFTYMLNQYKNWVNDELIIRDGRACQIVENGNLQNEADDRFASESCGLAGFLGTVEVVNLMSEILQAPDVGCYARLKPGCYDTIVNNADDARPPEETDIVLVNDNPAACDAFIPAQPTDERSPRRMALKVTATSPYSHVPDSTTCEGYVVPVDGLFETPVELGLGVARPANTLYDRDQYGYYFYIKPLVIGSWWDKWMAVKAIGDSNTDFIGVDASSDTRSFLISLNTLFGDDLNNLVGSTITDNVKRYGPVLKADGSLEPVPLLDIATGGGVDRSTLTEPAVNPDQQYTFRLLAMFNAAYNGQVTDRFEFGESLHVAHAHNVTDIAVPASVRSDPAQYTELTDPVTGLHYYALSQDRGAEGFYSIGYEFLNEIKDKYYVGGRNGPGAQFLPAYSGQFDFAPRQDIQILRIMSDTAAAFGYSDVWSGDVDF